MQNEPNVTIVRDFIQKFWNEADSSCLNQFLAEDYVDHAYVPNDMAGLTNMARVLHTAFPDQVSSEESIVSQGDRVVVRLKLRGTHTGNFRGTEATHQSVDVNLYREYRLAHGKIAEHWALFDTASLLRQIGAELHEQPACQIPRP
ncbi:Predicted ester cyclase [Paenibacillus sp. UNCCL117]|uniref:ester cyclase n=1 Tax=unclassified Paenibacillus TaxID=185978 RepID=UPI000891A6CA|nr:MULTISPECIES: ester cyclase [unclassified Paenibacillus]SDE49486.1 Predicted ester cyclase [Paenibacillus sp. cl123]SFW66904.1 Predicted ester cyclase [Paenibacillus sp. UNCCL117]